MTAKPPVAERRPHTISFHGDDRVDDWYWLRDDSREDPEVRAHLEAENAYYETELTHLDKLRERLFEEIKSRIKETDLSPPYRHKGWWYVSRTEEGKQYPRFCRSLDRPGDDPTDAESVMLDANVLAGDSEYFALGAFDVSPNSNLLIYSTDYNGSEKYTMRVKDLTTGEDLPDVLEGTTYGTAWLDDDTFFYVMPDEALRPYQVWRHTRGQSQSDDKLMFQEDDEKFRLGVWRSRTDRYVHLSIGSSNTSEEWVVRVDEPDSEFTVIAPRDEGIEYDIDHAPSPVDGDRFLLVTNADGAVNFKLVAAPVDTPDREHWVDVEPHRPEVRVEGVVPFRDHLVVFERAEALRRARIVDLENGSDRVLPTPEPVYALAPSVNREFDTTTVRYTYTSLVTPPSVFELDMVTDESTLLKQEPVLGDFDPEKYETDRLWAKAPDGTAVPVSWVARRDLPRDGSNPAVLYGYGSYEASMDPAFSSLRLSLLDRGFVWAVAHVRGGGEMGRPWYENGRMANKQNTFDDYIAAAEQLIAEGFTSPSKLVSWGGSAGGLLVGAVINKRPELFAAAVAQVPFVDCLTTILDPSLPLTAGEWEEWGNPIESVEVYEWMKEYSPYDNVRKADYPTMFVTTGYNDPRVSYWEPAKWVQKLRADSTSGKPIYLKVDLGSGHGGPSGRYDAWKDVALEYAFVLNALGMVDTA